MLSKKKTLSIYFTFLSVASFAQGWTPPGDPGFGGGTGDPATDPLETPIDSKIVYLLFVGVVFAFYYLKKKRTQVKD